jgi:porin
MSKLLFRICLSAAAIGCAWPLVSTPASAQSAAPAADTGPFAGITALGQTLKNDGIYLQLGYTEQIGAVVSGGLKTGTMPTGELYFGTVLDLQTILGIPGASFHVTFDERNGYTLNSIAGTQGPLQSNSGPTRATRLSEFFWEQAFFEDRLDFRVGRMNPTLDFATSDFACQFVSSILCAQPGSWYFANSNQSYPVSTWGGFVNVVPAANFYARAAVYDNDPSQGNPNQNGFNWNVSNSVGVFAPVEFGYQTNFTNALLPSHYELGFYDDASSFTDGTQTQLSSYVAPPGVNRQGRTAEWFLAEQTVWRPDQNTNQSLTLFGGGIVYNGGSPYWSQYYGGFLDRAPFGAVRPLDTVSFVASYYANNQNERPNKSTQWIYELDYGLGIIPGITLQPYTQFVVHPNNFLAPIGSKQPDNAWVVGVQVAIDFAAMFKFPIFTAH